MDHENKKISSADNDLDKARLKKRKLALLGIQGSSLEDEVDSSCPTNEEMARVIVDGKSLQDESELAQHIAHCDKCFREWLSLSQLIGTMGTTRIKRSRLSFLSTPGRLAAVGSGLAIAASVVVFYSLSPQQIDSVKVMKTEQVQTMQPNGSSVNTSSAESRERKVTRSAAVKKRAPALAIEAEEAKETEVTGDAFLEKSSLVEDKAFLGASPSLENIEDKAKTSLTFLTFSDAVLSYCNETSQEGNPTILAEQGRMLLSGSGDISARQKAVLQEIVKIMQNMKKWNKIASCQRLEVILTKN